MALNALQAAKKIIAERSKSQKAIMFGLADDLTVIGRAIDELDARSAINAEAHLLLFEHLKSLQSAPRVAPIIEALGQMSDNAGRIARRIVHGPTCTCVQCCPAS